MVKTVDVATLQKQVLMQLNYQDKASTTLKSSTGNGIIVS